jgi:S-(hydroxymethyl)glutathione dehydrogenase/alcohol dehydrogenase
MKTRAAILRQQPGEWEVVELDLDPPQAGEVLVRMVASGLCHSDDHVAKADAPIGTFPFCGGHEGAGVIEEVGPGVTGLEPGDHIITAFIPGCGKCRWCAEGKQNLCDRGALMMTGSQLDGTFRMHLDGQDVGQSSFLGTFAERTVMPADACIKIDKDISLEKAALLGCGVPTGWGSAVNAAQVEPGQVVIVMGVGGIGINAVQGAKHAGATRIIAVDPVEMKREAAMNFGATDAVASISEATELAQSITNGQGADSTIICVGLMDPANVGEAVDSIRKDGIVVITAVANYMHQAIPVNPFMLAMFQKRIQGALFGMMSPNRDVPRLLNMYVEGQLKLDELVTRTYTLDEINQGYADLLAGENLRGLIVYD